MTVPPNIVVPSPNESHWFIQLQNSSNNDFQGFYTGLNLPKFTQTLRGKVVARYDPNFSQDQAPKLAVFVSDIQEIGTGGQFVLIIIADLTSSFQEISFANFNLSAFQPVILYGFAVLMMANSRHEVQVASFQAEFV